MPTLLLLGNVTSGINADDFDLSNTVANHRNDTVRRGAFSGERARPFLDSPHTMNEIMQAADPIPDPGGVPGGLRWDVEGTFRGSEGVWELVVDANTNTVLHFNFVKN